MNKKKDTIKTNRKIIRKIEQIQVKNTLLARIHIGDVLCFILHHIRRHLMAGCPDDTKSDGNQISLLESHLCTLSLHSHKVNVTCFLTITHFMCKI